MDCDTGGDRPQQDPSACIRIRDRLPWREDRGVVGDDGIDVLLNGFVEDRFSQIDAEENPSNPVAG